MQSAFRDNSAIYLRQMPIRLEGGRGRDNGVSQELYSVDASVVHSDFKMNEEVEVKVGCGSRSEVKI